MEDKLIEKAKGDLEEAQRELAMATERVGKLSAFIEMYEIYSGNALPKGQPALGELAKMTIADGAEIILRSKDGTARAVDIIEMLKRAGKLKSKGKGNYGTVVQTLGRFPGRFEKIGPGTWRLVNRRESELRNDTTTIRSGEEARGLSTAILSPALLSEKGLAAGRPE